MSNWLTAPFESATSDKLIMGSVRKDVDKFRTNPKFHYRIDVEWHYEPDSLGMPDSVTGEIMEQVVDKIESTFKKDPVAVMTGIYTGEGVRDMVFYTPSLHIFQRKINEILADFPQLPLTFSAEDDPQWEEYSSMLEIALSDEQ